jgi:enolase-phosphatase E1
MEVNSTLTCRYTEAEAAKDAGVYALLVDRPGNAQLAEQDRERFPVIQRLTDLP